jgi:high-affinity K+ transport system ATPase subunit B
MAGKIAKYFAMSFAILNVVSEPRVINTILPAMFMAAMPAMNHLNIMHLHSPESAVLSALIFKLFPN